MGPNRPHPLLKGGLSIQISELDDHFVKYSFGKSREIFYLSFLKRRSCTCVLYSSSLTSMPSLEEVYRRIQASKKKQKELRDMYREALIQSKSFQEVKDELEKLTEKRRRLEAGIKNEFVNEQAQIDRLKLSVNADKQLLTDMAITQLMKGQTVEINDDDISLEPVYNVRFKRKDGSTAQAER